MIFSWKSQEKNSGIKEELMFGHIFKYRFKSMIRCFDVIFWTLAFPLLLSLFFYFGFGSFFESKEQFHVIPAAVVVEKENPYISQLFEELSVKGEDQMLELTFTDREEAERLLSDEKVEGIFTEGDELGLIFKKNGLSQSILKAIADNYAQVSALIKERAVTDPAGAAFMLKGITEDISLNKEITYTGGNMDSMLQYFYALLAMTCLYGSFSGLINAEQLQANLSPLAARKVAAPAHRMKMILGEFSASVLLQTAIIFIVILFLRFVLGIDFGNRFLPVIPLAFAGSILGVSFGFFIGCIGKASAQLKNYLMIAACMVLSFLSGLMIGDIKMWLERSCPIINRLNPAALIADAFYSLNIYDSYSRYLANLAGILIYAAVFCIGGFMLARRKKYASL